MTWTSPKTRTLESSSFFSRATLAAHPFDYPMVGGVCSDEDVTPDEVGAGDVRHREGLLAGVAEHVDPDLQLRLAHNRLGHCGHGSNGVGRESLLEERHVPDVLHDASVEPRGLELVGFGEGELRQFIDSSFPGAPGSGGTWIMPMMGLSRKSWENFTFASAFGGD